MADKPEYRFRFQIVDETSGEVVASDYTYMTTIDQVGACDSVDIHVSALLRGFNRAGQAEYERANYAPVETEDAA